MTEAERIEARELDHMAYAIRDMFLTAARDEQPSPAAVALLAIVRDRAPAALRPILIDRGFSAFTQLVPERAALWDHLKTITDEMGRSYIDQLAASQAGRMGVQGRFSDLSGATLAKMTERACMGLKSALSAFR